MGGYTGKDRDPPLQIHPAQKPGCVKLHRYYWYLIGAAMFFSSVASVSTLYLASASPAFMECNSVSAACFSAIGMGPCMAIGVLSLLPVMAAIPYIFRQNTEPGLVPVLLMGCIVLYTAFDALNNISVILGFSGTYRLAHTALTLTNNATGEIVGTGKSLC